MSLAVEKVEIYFFERPRTQPYLGGAEGEIVLGDRYVVRIFNGTVYPLNDRSIVVKVVNRDGVVGWGETYGLVAPKAVAAIITDLFGPYLTSRTFDDPAAVWDGLYSLQRVRGYWGGYLGDALAALDIALWDMHARAANVSLQAALGRAGGGRIPGYISGLPAKDKAARLAMAQSWKERGFGKLKIPSSHTDNGDIVGEFESLRKGLGDDHAIALDMHWVHTAESAIKLAHDLVPYKPWFLEAPVPPEDVETQRAVAKGSPSPMAIGEEWRTEWDYSLREECCAIVQPEMGHTGVTQFLRIAGRAKRLGAGVIPHATIGLGIFMSASLRAALVAGASDHEFQHTIYDRNAELLEGAAPCTNGSFDIPDTPGHGVTPTDDAFRFMTRLDD